MEFTITEKDFEQMTPQTTNYLVGGYINGVKDLKNLVEETIKAVDVVECFKICAEMEITPAYILVNGCKL